MEFRKATKQEYRDRLDILTPMLAERRHPARIIHSEEIPDLFYRHVCTMNRPAFIKRLGQCHSVPFTESLEYLLLDRFLSGKDLVEFAPVYEELMTEGWNDPVLGTLEETRDAYMTHLEQFQKGDDLRAIWLIEGVPPNTQRLIVGDGHHRLSIAHKIGLPIIAETCTAEAVIRGKSSHIGEIYQSIYLNEREIVKGVRQDAIQRLHRVRPEDIRGKRILDLGCNNGHPTLLTIEFGAREAVGVEKEEKLVDYALTINTLYGYSCDFVHHDLDTPFDGGKFDTLFCFSVYMWTHLLPLIQTIHNAGANVMYFEGHGQTASEIKDRRKYSGVLDLYKYVEFLGWNQVNRAFFRCEELKSG